MTPSPADQIVVSGAREHNLKDVTVVAAARRDRRHHGLSGSGKSSLAFDTIYAEGQRRYVESLSAYARQFLGQMDKPDVDSIEGLSPAISIDQKTTSRNPRSTVGTVTEIYDYLRLLWSRVGQPHCHVCGRPIAGQSTEQIIDQVLELPDETRFMVDGARRARAQGRVRELLEELRGEGFTRAKIDGEVRLLEEDDRARQEVQARHLGRGRPPAHARRTCASGWPTRSRPRSAWPTASSTSSSSTAARSRTFSEHFTCLHDGTSMPELEPRIFSFNSPHGACPRCTGLGSQMEIDPELIVPDPSLSIGEGAIAALVDQRVGLLRADHRGDRRALRDRPGRAVGGPARGAAGLLPLRHQRRPDLRLLPQPDGPQALLHDHVRGDRPQPRAALPRDRLRLRRARRSRSTCRSCPARSARARGCGPSRARCSWAGCRSTSSRRCRAHAGAGVDRARSSSPTSSGGSPG